MSDDDATAADGASPGNGTAADETPDDGEFAAEIERARRLLDGDDIEAVHVGVVRDGEIDTTFAQRSGGGPEGDDPEGEGLRALALLAAHARLVANEAGVEASTVAGDAATLAGQVDRIPAGTDDLPEE